MPAAEGQEWELARLNQRIDELDALTPTVRAERAGAATRAARARRRLAYLRAARWIRAPRAILEMWNVGLLAIGLLAAGVLALAAMSLAVNSLTAGLLAFAVGAAGGGAALGLLLFRPDDAELPSAVAAAEAERGLAEVASRDALERLAKTIEEHHALVEQRRALMASGQVQRAALLQRAWKTMPPAEWEDFLVEVCRTLGYSAERVPGSTAPTAELIIAKDSRRVAVVTRADEKTVSSAAVQRALAAMEALGCQGCATIINRRFTGAAHDFARHRGCVAIGVDEFPDFALGKIEL